MARAQPSAPQSRLKTIYVLQAGRALAALAVVAHHAAASAETFSGDLPAWLKVLTDRGYLGVDFFFVLSGFIISYVNRQEGPWFRQYASSRSERIFVPYLPIGIAIALAYTLVPNLSAGDRDWSWIASLTLLPVGQPALIVAWTLQFEVAFYLIFALAKFLGRPISIVAMWAAAMILLAVIDPELGPVALSITVEFLFGMLAVEAVSRKVPAVVPALACFAAYYFIPQREIFGAAMAFLVVALVRAEHAGRLSTPAWLVFLGAASYSIYLIHNPVAALTARFFDHWFWGFAVAAVLGTLGGVAYHMLIERPLLRRVKLYRTRRDTRAVVE